MKDLTKEISEFMEKLPKDIAVIAQNYTYDAFETESWDGQKWKARKDGDTGRKLLIGHFSGGQLRKSMDFLATKNEVIISNDKPYAQIHNEGGQIKQTPTAKQRAFFMNRYRSVNDSKYKAMALSKQLVINIPKRQFMGFSKEMFDKIEDHIERKLDKILRS